VKKIVDVVNTHSLVSIT